MKQIGCFQVLENLDHRGARGCEKESGSRLAKRWRKRWAKRGVENRIFLDFFFLELLEGSSGLPAVDRKTLDLSVHKPHVGLFSARPVTDQNLPGTGDCVSHGQRRDAF